MILYKRLVILLPTSIVMYGHWSHKYIKYHILNTVVNGYDIEMVCDCHHCEINVIQINM